MKTAFAQDYNFIIEELLDGFTPVTSKMIQMMLKEKQFKILSNMISIPTDLLNKVKRPIYINLDAKK